MSNELEDARIQLAELGKTNLAFLTEAILYPQRETAHPPFVYNHCLHRELAYIIETDQFSRKLIMIPRGHYKTTFGNARAIQWTIQNPNNRILLVGATTTGPERRLRHIRSTYESNPLFRWLYPEIVADFNKLQWAATQATINRTQSFPEPTFDTAGVGTALPGRHYSKIIKDDIVNDKNSNSPELEDQVIEWDAGTIPLFDAPEDPSNEELVIGTPWTNTDLYSLKRKDSDYAVYVRHSLENEKGEPDYEHGAPIFPERFSKIRLEKIRKRLNNSDLFYCQYMCDPYGQSGAGFNKDYIQYYDKAPDNLMISITVDPGGLTDLTKSDPTAIVVVGVDVRNDWYVLWIDNRRMNPREIVDAIFATYAKYPSAHTIGLEEIAWQKALRFYLEEEMRKQNVFLPLKTLKLDSHVRKPMRIAGLVPRFSNKSVWMKSSMKVLEDQMFKRVKNDDVIDALAYQLQIATITPQGAVQKHSDPFCIDDILAELSGKNVHAASMLERGLAESYRDPNGYFKQLEVP